MIPEAPLELIHGSGNVYRDFGYPDADVRQLKSLLASEIIKTLDREALTVRQAQERTGIAAADFSRIRNADLKRFTLDRLMAIVGKLGSRIEITLKIKPAPKRVSNPRASVLVAAEPKAPRHAPPMARTVAARLAQGDAVRAKRPPAKGAKASRSLPRGRARSSTP